MASPDIDSHWSFSTDEYLRRSFDNQLEEGFSEDGLDMQEIPAMHVNMSHSVPKPPPCPGRIQTKNNYLISLPGVCCLTSVPNETKYIWDKLFREGCAADVCVVTENGAIIRAHFIVLNLASSVLGNLLKQSKVINGFRYITIPGVPYDTVYTFIRFLYSSCYEENDMKRYALHLLVLSHCYSVPSLKRICQNVLEHDFLSTENVIDVLQLARDCDAPRLSFICARMVVRDFKTISSTEGWKVMTRANPSLEQVLLELVVEEDSRNQERLKKNEEKKMYLQLYEAMEALLHIFQDGCRTIGPRDKVLKESQVSCNFPACKGLETLVRHFSSCKARVPGGCVHCKRMWQLLELHSRMCNDSDYCRVPLCRHFKEKVQKQSKKVETKWKLLVSKVEAAKRSSGPFPSRWSAFL